MIKKMLIRKNHKPGYLITEDEINDVRAAWKSDENHQALKGALQLYLTSKQPSLELDENKSGFVQGRLSSSAEKSVPTGLIHYDFLHIQ